MSSCEFSSRITLNQLNKGGLLNFTVERVGSHKVSQDCDKIVENPQFCLHSSNLKRSDQQPSTRIFLEIIRINESYQIFFQEDIEGLLRTRQPLFILKLNQRLSRGKDIIGSFKIRHPDCRRGQMGFNLRLAF